MTLSQLHDEVSRLIEDGLGDCHTFLRASHREPNLVPFELTRLRPRLVTTVRKTDGDKVSQMRVDLEFDRTLQEPKS